MANHSSFTILLEPETHRYAAQFAAEQTSVAKGQRVYLNTLAVCAVNSYMNWLSIDTALHRSDCWHGELRSVFDVADLILPEAGRVECRPILPGESNLNIPTPAHTYCLGYVAVELDSNLKQASLLGFVSANAALAGTEQIALNQLTPLDDLIDAIHHAKRTVKLKLWLDQIFQQDWQRPTQVLSAAFRSSRVNQVDALNTSQAMISRGKLVTFDHGDPVVIVLTLMGDVAGTGNIRVQVFPAGPSIKLPQGLQVILLDEAETICANSMSHGDNDWIELEFSITTGEQFSLQLVLDEQTVTEMFEF